MESRNLLDIGTPASLVRRVGAMAYDFLLITALIILNVIITITITQKVVSGAIFQSILFLEIFGFYSYFWVAKGQTLGMLAWNLKIVNSKGQRLSPKQAMLRFIGGLLALLSCGLGIIWQIFDAHQRNWPDLISGTRILHIPRNKVS